jgi:hypothetical protein
MATYSINAQPPAQKYSQGQKEAIGLGKPNRPRSPKWVIWR